jgi:hypothetical protein
MPRLLDPQQALTPREVEEILSELYNESAKAEIEMRRLLDQELDARLAYERALIAATVDPDCPKVSTNPRVTVDERDAWIRGVIFDEYEGFEMAKKNVKIQQRYIDRLCEQTTKIQTISKHVLQAYALPQSGVGGR